MKIFVHIILIYVLFHSCINEKGGVKLSINKKMLKLILKYFTDDINKEIKDIYIGNEKNFENIKFGISNFNEDKVDITLKESDKINLKIKYIKAKLELVYHTKVLWFIPVSTDLKVNFKDLSISFDIKIGGKGDSNGNLIPDANVVDGSVDVKIDFDFNLSGILDWGAIKWMLRNTVHNTIVNKIKDKIKDLLISGLDKIPKSVTINEKLGLYLDYSLISPLIIRHNSILVNSYALLYNKNIKETQNKYNFELTNNLIDYDENGKYFQVFFGDYAIKNMLFTLYKSNFLNFTLNPEFLNKTISQKLNIELISKLYKGLDDLYEKEKEVNITFKVKSLPYIELVKEYIYLFVPTSIEICIVGEECILSYDTNIEIKGDVIIKEN